MTVHPDLTLRLGHQHLRHAGPTLRSCDVDLLDLVLHDHDEAHDDTVHGGDRRVADPLRGPRPERLVGARNHQLLRDEALVTVAPPEPPISATSSESPGTALRSSTAARPERSRELVRLPR